MFASALHPAFVTSGLALLLVAVLALSLLGRGGQITTHGAPAEKTIEEVPAAQDLPTPDAMPAN